MKKISLILLVLVLLFTGCSSNDGKQVAEMENTEFNEYLDSLIVDSIVPSQLDINYLFEKPEDFGIEPQPYELGFTDEASFKEDINWSKETVKKLQSFNNASLTQQQQIDRDVLIYQFQTSVEAENFYDYEVGSSFLGSSRSTSINLPATLDIYSFRNERDVEYYIHFLETLDSYVQQYVDLEHGRQERGTGFGQEEIDEIIELSQETYTSALKDDYYLIRSFNRRIDEVDFLSDQEKETYKAKNIVAIQTHFANTYKLIVDGLSDITATASTGLANKPNGEAYFEYQLKVNTGKEVTAKQLDKDIDSHFNSLLLRVNIMPDLFDNFTNFEYHSFTDGYELLDSIYKDMVGIYPLIGTIKYEINTVDESMSAGSSPAFYFTPAVDYSDDEKQFIFVNGDFDSNNYSTYAHEGFPGHMYQFSYFLTLNNHPIRRLYTDNGNAEGWAKYTERQIFFTTRNQEEAEFADVYTQLLEAIYLKMEMGVQYEGWTFEEFKQYITSILVFEDDSELMDTYLYLVNTPAVNATYYLSSKYIEDEKNKVKEALGDSYSDLTFHTWFLSMGSAPLDVVSQYMDVFIEKEGNE